MTKATDFNINLIGKEPEVRERIRKHIENGDFSLPKNEKVWAVGQTSVRARISFPKPKTSEEAREFLFRNNKDVLRVESVSIACMGSKCLG